LQPAPSGDIILLNNHSVERKKENENDSADDYIIEYGRHH